MSVLQDWVECISWKKQTVLFGAVRAPDVVTTLKLKQVTVWIRAHTIKDADPMSGFMYKGLRPLPLFDQIDREFERLPLHTAHHIMLAMQVIGHEYDLADEQIETEETRRDALGFYHDAVIAQHLNPETRAQYEARYSDNPERIEVGTS